MGIIMVGLSEVLLYTVSIDLTHHTRSRICLLPLAKSWKLLSVYLLHELSTHFDMGEVMIQGLERSFSRSRELQFIQLRTDIFGTD